MRVEDFLEWKWSDIENVLPEIKESKTDVIQISPVQPCKADLEYKWYFLFQPFGFTIGNCKGTKEELKSLCSKAKDLGIKVSVNLIINHTASDDNNCSIPHKYVDDELKNNRFIWKYQKMIEDWEDRYECVNYCNGLPALELGNHDLQEIIFNFINELIEIGVSAFRIDAAKHIKLPCEGSDFFERLSDKFKDILLYGETIFCNKELLQEYQKYILTLNNLSNEAYNIDRDKEIVFVESHDSFLDSDIGYTRKLSEQQVLENYNYLKKDFPNTIHYNRPFSNAWKYANR